MIPRGLLCLLLGVLLTGCGARLRAPVRPPIGLLYTSVRAPLQTDFDETTFGSKRAEAYTNYLLVPLNPFALFPFDVAWGEVAIAKAMDEGEITTVHHVDYELLNVIGLYARLTVYVYGD